METDEKKTGNLEKIENRARQAPAKEKERYNECSLVLRLLALSQTVIFELQLSYSTLV